MSTKGVIKVCAFAVGLLAMFCLPLIGIHHRDSNKTSATQTANERTVVAPAPQAPADEIKTIKVGEDLVYLYHMRDGKLVHFGDPRFVMEKARDVAAQNHARVLSINPDYGETFVGARVTAGVYVTLIHDN